MTQEPEGQATSQPAAMLPIQVNAQYIKDLSFENPNAPQSLQPNQAPNIEVNVDVNAAGLAEDRFEVVLSISAKASQENETVFLAELSYAGLFTLQGFSREQLQAVLLIECPRLLFPFARSIIADATRDGGFPPLLVQPVDFAEIYRRGLATGAVSVEEEGSVPN